MTTPSLLYRRRYLACTFIVSMLCLTLTMRADVIENYTLDNGLNVVLLKDDSAPIITVKTVVGLGSLYEGPFIGAGISHYLEHIVAGGSTHLHPESHYKKTISLLGGVSNAYTTTDHTAYFINTSPEHLDTALTTLYEWMFHCSFNPSEVTREQAVITREIEKTNSNVQRKFYYLSQENTYSSHPARIPVIGYLDVFKTITRDDLLSIYKQYYTAANMTVVIGGAIDIADTKHRVSKLFSTEKKHPLPIHALKNDPLPFSKRTKTHYLPMTSSLVSLRFPTVDLYSDALYPLDLLDYILGNGNQSILHQALVENEKLAYSVATFSYTPSYTTGYFEILIETKPENTSAAIAKTKHILDVYTKKDIAHTIIKRAKKQKLSENALAITSIEDKTNRLAQSFLLSGTTTFYSDYANQFKDLTATDLRTTAAKFFNPNRLVTTIGHPSTLPNQKQSGTKTPPLDTTVSKIVLENGLRILLYPNKSMPVLNAQILVEGGILKETESTNGAGNLIASLLGKETHHHSKKEIEKAFEDNGAYLNAAVGNHSLYYTLDCLSEDTPLLFPLFIDTFFNARFPEHEITEEKRLITNAILKKQDDWFKHAHTAFKAFFWQTYPYSRPLSGTTQTVQALDKATLTSFFNELKDPKRTIISVSGDFNIDTILATLKGIQFTKSKSKTTSNPAPSPPTHTQAITKTRQHKFETSVLFMGFMGCTLTSLSDKIKLDLVDAILTGMSYPGGRLHNKLRDKGYVYMVHGSSFNGPDTGNFYIYALTNPQSLAAVHKIILEEIHDLKTNPVSDNEFNEAIARLRFHYRSRLSSTENKLLIHAIDELMENNFDTLLSIENEINTLKKSDISKTVLHYFNHPQVLQFNPENT